MKRRPTAVLVLAVLLSGIGPGRAGALPGGSDLEAAIAADAERARATAANDLAALDRLFAADAVYTHSTGRVETKAEFLDRIRTGERHYRAMKSRDVAARPAAGAVVVTGKAEGAVEVAGQTIALSLIYTAVYVERDGRWQLLAYESTKPPDAPEKEVPVTHRGTGEFDVKMAPLKAEEGSTLARYALDKQYHGALDGRSVGEMLSAGTAVKNSAGYVAFEQFTGKLDGKAGGFVLQHSATMTRGDGKLMITVVPDSGTGALTGIAGTMGIRIEGGKHFYDFDYTLP